MNLKRFSLLLAFAVFMCSSVVALAVEVPTGVSFTDLTSGDIVIGSSGVSTFSIDPPTGGSGYPYTYFQGYQYYSGSSTTFNSSTSFTDGYAVYPSSTQTNFSSRLYNPVNNITVYADTPFYFWVDMFVTTDGSTPIAASILSNLNFVISPRNVRTNIDTNYAALVSLASSDILSYDATTGHLTGYVFFSDGLPANASVAAGAAAADSNFFIGIQGGAGYQYKISNVIFMAEPANFTPPGAGGGGDDPAEPTFEEQVLEDLDNIQSNQQAQTEQISGAIQDQTDAMLSEDEETGLIGKLVKKIKELFIPSDEYFSDFWDRLNQFFADRFGFLWFPIEHFIDWIGRLMDLEDTQPTIAIPELAFDDHVLIPAQTYTFDFLASEPWATIHGYYLLAIDAALIMAFVGLLGDKLKEVMNR